VIAGDPADAFGFPRLVADYLTWMGAHGYSPTSINSRRVALGLASDWLVDRGIERPVEVTRPVLESYQRWLFTYRRPDGIALSFRTQAQRLMAVRGFFKWAAKERHVLHNPAGELVLPKVEQRLPRPALSRSEVEAVMAVPDVTSVLGLRDRAVLETFWSTGIRRAELANLSVFDLDPERATLLVRQGKGRKDRMVPVGDRALGWLRRWLDTGRPQLAPDPDDGTLFLTETGAPLRLDWLTGMVRKQLHAAGVGKDGACHLFRHTCATGMLDGGADIRHVQVLLGHADLSTTAVYAQVSIRTLQAVHAATHPAGQHRQRAESHDVASAPGGLSLSGKEDQLKNRADPGSTTTTD
jgi:integrase/recombinase XerD